MKSFKIIHFSIPVKSFKTNFTYKILPFFLLMFLTGNSIVFSQNEYSGIVPIIPVKGFIITNSGDTIQGKIKYRKFKENFMSEIRFTGLDGKNTIYKAGNINGMGIRITPIDDNEDYVSLRDPFWDIYECRLSPKKKVMVFINRFTNGRIKVFQNRSSIVYGGNITKTTSKFDGIYFEFSSIDGLYIAPSFKVSYQTIASKSWASSYYFEKDKGEMKKITKKNFDALWSELFGDCTKIKEEVINNPDLKNYNNFVLIVNLYNQLCN